MYRSVSARAGGGKGAAKKPRTAYFTLSVIKWAEMKTMKNPGQIINADCMEALRGMPDGGFALTLFSPPYDGIRDYNGAWQTDFPALGAELFRLTMDGGMCAVVMGDGTKNYAKTLTTFSLAVEWCKCAGWRLFECCLYHRDGNPGAWWSRRFRVDHEYILLFLKGDKPRIFDKQHLMVPAKHAGKIYSGTDRLTNGTTKKIARKAVNPTKCRGTVWRYATSNSEGNKTKLRHPATFPDNLARDIILCFSREGDPVLDPMCGSGTTCVMAAKYGRRYTGVEISEEYCKIADERIRREAHAEIFSPVAKTEKRNARI